MTTTLLVIVVMGFAVLAGSFLLSRAVPGLPLGLAGALALALWLIAVLAVAMPFGWQAPLGDAAALVLLVGAGFFAYRSSNLVTRYAPLDWALLGVVALAFAAPALVLPVPLDTDAQGFGYLALTARLGGNLTTLAPYQPEIDYLYAPGFTVLVAYLSERLGTPLHSTQFGAAAVLAVLLVMVLFDFGHALGGVVRARAHVLAAVIGTGLGTAYMDSHYTSVIGLVFGGAFLTMIYRVVYPHSHRDHEREDEMNLTPIHVVLASIYLAALVLVHPDTTIIIALGFGAWLLLMPLANPRPSVQRWLTAALGVPFLALVLVLPWLLSVVPLLGSDITSPFERFGYHWRVVLGVPPHTLYHGGVITLIGLVGVVLGVRERRTEAWFALGWLLLVLDFSAFGVLDRVIPALVAPIKRYDYPFSIAWHGPIIPYVLLGGLALAAAWQFAQRWARAWHALPLRKFAYGGLALVAVGIVLAGVFNRELLALSKGRVTFFGAFTSHADVAAMTWLRENTEPDALVLNFPGPQEGDWVPVIAERQAIYYRPQPFFQRGDDDPLADTPQQVAMRAFWQDPANPAHAALLQNAGVDYVIVPQVVGNPASFAAHFRWRRPFTDLIDMQSAVADADYLERVFDADGAQIYRLR